MSLSYVRSDGNGHFLRVDVCTCELSDPNFYAPDDWEPTDETCPIYDRHRALRERMWTPLP